jgi:hypothetical protein
VAPVMAALPPQVDVARIAALKVVQLFGLKFPSSSAIHALALSLGNEDCALA